MPKPLRTWILFARLQFFSLFLAYLFDVSQVLRADAMLQKKNRSEALCLEERLYSHN